MVFLMCQLFYASKGLIFEDFLFKSILKKMSFLRFYCHDRHE